MNSIKKTSIIFYFNFNKKAKSQCSGQAARGVTIFDMVHPPNISLRNDDKVRVTSSNGAKKYLLAFLQDPDSFPRGIYIAGTYWKSNGIDHYHFRSKYINHEVKELEREEDAHDTNMGSLSAGIQDRLHAQ